MIKLFVYPFKQVFYLLDNGLFKSLNLNFTGITGHPGDTGAKGDKGMNLKDCFLVSSFNFSPIGQFYSRFSRF